MATLTKTVKASGGDYTTIAGALAFFDNYDFVGDGTYDTFEVVIYPEGGGTNNEWVITSALTVTSDSAAKTSATRYLTIRGSAGFSFGDTDPLRYDNAKGVSISNTTTFSSVFSSLPNYTRVVDLQLTTTQAATTIFDLTETGAAYNDQIRVLRCIGKTGSSTYVVNYNQSAKKLTAIASLFYGGTSQAVNHAYSTTDDFVACTVYCSSSNDALLYPSGGTAANDVISTIAFNAGAGNAFMSSATYSVSSRNCGADDTTGPSTGKISNLVVDGSNGAKDVFYSVTGGSEDFRIKTTATDVTTAGYAASSYTGGIDIRGTTFAGSPTIGCWQAPVGGTVQSLMQISG